MKNLLTELKTCIKNKYTESHKIEEQDCDETGKLKLFVILQYIEEFQKGPASCLEKIAPQYKKDLTQVDLKMFADAHCGDTIELEAKFYEVDKRKVELKVFVRKIKKNKTTNRICKAKYTFQAIYDSEAA